MSHQPPPAATVVRPPTRGRTARGRLAITALGLLVALVSTGCSGEESPAPKPAPAPTTPPVADDLAALTVPRAEFCDRADSLTLRAGLPEPSVGASASPSPSTSTSASASPSPSVQESEAATIQLVAWTNGDKLEGRSGGDVSHEYGCRWTAPDQPGSSAAGWVFVPPADAARATSLGRRLGEIEGADCRRLPASGSAADFGNAPAAVTCTTTSKKPGKRANLVRWAGLFGDAWLVCEVTGPRARARAEQFCPALVTAISQDA